MFAGVLAGFEWLRGHVLTGLPWDLPGETWRAGSAPSQAASLVGAYGLTWITLVIAAAPAVLVGPRGWRSRAAALTLAAAALAGLYGFGAWRLEGAARPRPGAPVVRVVQANIDQKNKWKPQNLGMIFDTYVGLTTARAAVRPAIVIWPEGALPAVIDELVAPGSAYTPCCAPRPRPARRSRWAPTAPNPMRPARRATSTAWSPSAARARGCGSPGSTTSII